MADLTDKIVAPPGTIATPSLSPLYVDGLPIVDATAGVQSLITPGHQGAADQRFWASPPRPLNDIHDETIIVNLSKPKLLNFISLDLPQFPHHFYIHYYDSKAKQWKSITGDNGFDIRIYIDGAVPQVIGPMNVLQAHQHPSHYGADHWIHYDVDIMPITTSKLRFSGNRGFGSKAGGPVDIHGKPAAYSLGIRNLDFGYRVRKKSDIPLTDRKPDIVTERESFTTVVDMLGSSVDLSIRENRASDLLQNRIWKCAPQPFSYAVVNLYVDARDSAGNSQVIDRFYLDPITSGVTVNVYHTEDVPQPHNFTASDAPLSFPMSRAAGQVDPSIDGEGLYFPDQISYLDLDNQAIQWDPTRPWWMAVNFQPQFNSTNTDDHLIWDAGEFQLMWTQSQWTLSFDDGALVLPSGDFSYNEQIQLVVSFDGTQLQFYYAGLWVASSPATFKNISVETLRFGAELGLSTEQTIITGAYRLKSLVLKQESISFISGPAGLVIPDQVQGFINDSENYVRKAQFDSDESHSTDNSILRFSPTFRLGDKDGLNPWGFQGGPGDVYADLVWTPVTRDYKLARGYMQLNPTRATVFKFEFTNLHAQPYDVYTPHTTKVQVFPESVVKNSLPAQATGPSNVTSSGLQANFDATHPYTYADAIRLLFIQQTTVSKIPPTEALVARDPATADRLKQFGNLYNFHPWQPPAVAPSFPTVSQHYYETVEVTHSSRVAYFVALASLKMYRLDYTTNDDTEIYLESFTDTQHLDRELLIPQNVQAATNWAVNPSFELDSNSDGMPDSYTLVTQGAVTGNVAQSSVESLFGSYSMCATASILGPNGTDRLGFSFLPTGLNFANGVAVSIYAKVTEGTPTLRANVEYYNSSNVFISSDSTSLIHVGATWQRLEGIFTAPSNTDHIKVYFWAEAGGGNPVVVYFDGVQVEESIVSDYCDGDQPGCAWIGTANNSASERTGISTSPWKHSSNGLTTPVNLSDPAVATSVILTSKRKVRGLQYATQQSSAVQLLIDPDFDDPELRAWSKLGDVAPLTLSEDFNASIGSTVQLTRQSGIGTWNSLETEWESWNDLEASDSNENRPRWDDLENTLAGSAYGGLRYTATVETTKAGRIYAAARVFATQPLNQPLVLQILDEDGDVLAEAEQNIAGGHVSEWYVGYTIGDVGTEVLDTWSDLENRDPSPTLPTWNDLEIYTWDSLDTTIQPAGTRVSAQIIQRGETNDIWFVDNMSLFEDAIVWEFSNDGGKSWWPVFDIRNDPHGTFIFPDPTTPEPSSGTQLMWRVTGYRPNLHINYLAIRPWYGSLPLGVPHREPGMGGPNIQPTDHYCPVTEDPRWQVWHDPIPQDWWFVQRQLLSLNRPYIPVDTSTPSKKADLWINPHALVPLEPPPPIDEGEPSPPAGPELYEDIYGDPYPGTYGPEAGGATYTDNYGNNTY